MAKAKDFSTINTANQYSKAIDEATQEKKKAYYINIDFGADLYDYVRTMSNALNISYAKFLRGLVEQHKENNDKLYKQALKLREAIEESE